MRAWTPRLSAAALVRCPIIIAALAGTWTAVTVTMPSLVRGHETRFSSPRQALGLQGFSGARLNSTGTRPRIAHGWYTSDAGGAGAQTRTGTKRPATDPPCPAGDGLPGELGVDAGYGPSGTSSCGESPPPTDVDWISRCDFFKMKNTTLSTPICIFFSL